MALSLCEGVQLRLDGVEGYSTEVVPLASRDDGERDLVDFGCGEDEDGVAGRLFEGLQERVECRLGEHVDFVDDVDLVAALVRRVPDLVAQIANVVDAAVAGRVDLDEVERAGLVDRLADFARIVRLPVLRVAAVGGLRHDAGGARLARSARAGEQVRMGEPSERHGVPQRLRDGLLSDDLFQSPRTPFSV